jgi:hypothetical protein
MRGSPFFRSKTIDCLGGHEAHGGAEHCLGYRLGVAEVVLVALAERLHELRRDQLHIVAQGQQLTAAMMSANTGLHADQASWHVGQPSLNLPTGELLAQDNGAANI